MTYLMMTAYWLQARDDQSCDDSPGLREVVCDGKVVPGVLTYPDIQKRLQRAQE